LALLQVVAVGAIVLSGLPLRWRVPAVAACAALAFGVQHSARDRLVAASAIDHAMIYGGLLALFAASLRPGRIDLVTEMAVRTQGPLVPEMARYTRRVTWAWCGFFAGDLATSLALYLAAPLDWWSLFVNVLDLPLVLAMFAAEYTVRRIALRHLAHVTVLQTIRAFARRPATLPDGVG
jgi:uncharacterized membrane protein